MERQNKLIEELRERLKEAEMEKEKHTKYQNYIEARKSKRNSDPLKLIREEVPKEETAEAVEKATPKAVFASPYQQPLSRKSKSPQ